MTENVNDQSKADGYQIFVVNIKYGNDFGRRSREKPGMATLDVPEGIMKTMHDAQKFMDNVESFAYNTLTRKYGAEVTHCQIFLPL